MKAATRTAIAHCKGQSLPPEVEGDVLKCLGLDIQPRRTRIWTRGLTVPKSRRSRPPKSI